MAPLDTTGTTTETSLIIEEGVTSMDDFYNEITRLLKLETWFGRNLMAFNDVLRGGCGEIDPAGKTFVWKGSTAARDSIGQGNWNTIMEIFHDDNNSGHENFNVKLE